MDSWNISAKPETGPRRWNSVSTFVELVHSLVTVSKTRAIAAGVYQLPFRFNLEASLPESVDGLNDIWIKYRLKVEVGRKLRRDIRIEEPVRLVRAHDLTLLHFHADMVQSTRPVISSG